MADNLYNSYNIEYSRQVYPSDITEQAVSFSFWSDKPYTKLKVGSSLQYNKNVFSPEILSNYTEHYIPPEEFDGSGTFFVITKIRITDEVIGEQNGYPFRQWQFTLDGYVTRKAPSYDSQGHEIISYDDPPVITKYSTHTEKLDNNDILVKASLETINFGDEPLFLYAIDEQIEIPGIPVPLTCTNYSYNDSINDINLKSWTVTYEAYGIIHYEGDFQPTPKFNLAIEKDSDGIILKSGSMSVVHSGDSPSINIQVGDTFSIPGIGEVTCSKVSGSDDYTDTGAHRWTMTYEGVINDDSSSDDQPQTDSPDTKYNFSVERNNSGGLSHSGSVEITSISNTPPSAYQVGSTINIPGVGEVTCVKVSGSDSYTDNGRRKWVIVYEGTDSSNDSSEQQQTTGIKYSFDIENNSDGVTVYSGSKEVPYLGSNPNPDISVGDSFSLPVVGTLTCTKVRGSDDGAGAWSFIIEGIRTGADSSGEQQQDTSLPETETSINYEFNGSTVRTVEGNIIALRRSLNPIVKKSITVYSDSDTLLSVPGSVYQGGIALSENVIKETIKNNGVVTASYFKHTIEVEA